MRLLGSIYAYEAMGRVVVTARVWDERRETAERGIDLLTARTEFAGTGEDDPREWLRDALVGMLEDM